MKEVGILKVYKKFFSPLFIDLIKQKTIRLSDDEVEYPLISGVMNEEENYGFVLIAMKDGKQYMQEFGTEERIDALGIEENRLLVFEDGKQTPWVFGLNGELQKEAKYDFNFISDRERFYEKYGKVEKNEDHAKTL